MSQVDDAYEQLKKLSREELIAKARAAAKLEKRDIKKECETSLVNFIRHAWSQVEPGAPYVHGWHIEAVCMHLEAVADGEINRLLINIPPGMMKSLATTVFFPAWLWGPKDQSHLRFLCASHSQSLAVRDSTKMRRLVQSEWYQAFWGDRVILTGDQNSKLKFETQTFGFREAVAAGSITGSRGDYVLIDDPHSVEGASSDAMRNTTKEWFLEAVPTRLNNPKKSAIVVIMQRLHEEDVSGIILEKNLGYDHLMLPMQFDSDRKCRTSIGFEDPRQEDGELLFPKRFPLDVVERDKLVMGPYASSGQFQQSPVPRGGGIIKRDYWQLWDDETAQSQGISSSAKYPPMDYVVASLDPAFTSKKENDPSALTIWGVWQKGGQSARRILGRTGDVVDYIDDRDTVPCLMLMHAWAKRLPIHGSYTERMPGETEEAFKLRQQENWGLVEWVVDTCSRYNIDTLLIESKGSGISVSQEIQRLNRTLTWSVHQINPGNADKVARAYAVQPIFSNGTVYAPDRAWADKVITEAENFPKGKHDDLVDSTTQALKFMRERGLLRRPEEIIASIKNEVSSPFRVKPIYDV
jgi:predicted phage terminase large subunit-like protein